MTRTTLQFASVAINTDPVPKPGELTVAQNYTILAEQGSNKQKLKSWVKKNYPFFSISLRKTIGIHVQLELRIFDSGR